MKNRIIALVILVTSVQAPLAIYAATCGNLTGDVCGKINGECVCYDYPPKK